MKQYKSKERIINYGEVFTDIKTINKMLDLIPKDFLLKDDIKILEPAVGTGNFLIEIIKRKIKNKSKDEIRKILSNIYAYDILEDNVKETINNIQKLFDFNVKDILIKNIKEADFLKLNFKKNKFNLVIGNPPYQVPDGSYGRGARPLYNLFTEKIIDEIEPEYFSFIIPSRWLTGGKGLSKFRKKMLNDKRFKYIIDSFDSKRYFPDVEVEGGILYFLWDKKYNSKCNYTLIEENSTKQRSLNEFDIFIRTNIGLPILYKVLEKHTGSFLSTKIIRSNFGFKTNYSNFKLEEDGEYNIKFYSKHKLLNNKLYGYVRKEDIKSQHELINKYKVITTKARGGTFKDKKIITDVYITEIPSVTSQSFVILNVFDTLQEAEKFQKYMKTKFVRYLIKLRKYTQDISINTFKFVPLLDLANLTKNIKTIDELDEILYKYFNLTNSEIEIIENNIIRI